MRSTAHLSADIMTLKTPSGRPKLSSSHSHTQSKPHSRPHRTSGTPLASPRHPHSVGQPCPPKLESPTKSRLAPSSVTAACNPVNDARSPSPNYFGLTVEPVAEGCESASVPRDHWSPPTSSVRSFAGAQTRHMPLDANPEFEAFRMQADANRGGGSFSLSTSHFGEPPASTPSASLRVRQPGLIQGGDTAEISQSPAAISPRALPPRTPGFPLNFPGVLAGAKMDVDSRNSAYVSAESKRGSDVSLGAPSFFNMGRHESPAAVGESAFGAPGQRRSHISKTDDRHPRLSLVQNKADPPTPPAGLPQHAHHRAQTDPAPAAENVPGLINPGELRELMANVPESEILILDLRVSPQYALSRVKGALNLCIPTTLLKRATFNLTKLQQTFQADGEQERFARWRVTRYLVVYDAFSSDRRDAVSAMNMVRKFAAEGYTGTSGILRGGFNAFAASCPQLVDRVNLAGVGGGFANSSLSLGAAGDGRTIVAPVIGGVMLPNMNSNPNPFFSNIRQNQDLVDGVGQMDLGVPTGLDVEAGLPSWLSAAAATENHGKTVSDKFLRIEVQEQSRMKEAYSVVNPEDNVGEKAKVQLSGIEKGTKNRYKDILPFEHARVHLKGKEDGSCDYVNASHLKASRSHKRYIASQGPLPATFEDFWSVIWDQDVRVIVMLTAESEGGQLKCHPYWSGREFGPIKLRSLSEKKVSLDFEHHRSSSHNHSLSMANSSSSDSSASTVTGPSPTASAGGGNPFNWAAPSSDFARRRANTSSNPDHTPNHPSSGTVNETPHVLVRKFALSHAGHPFAPIREITQLHYASWPDFGAPAQPIHLLALVELANVMQRASMSSVTSRKSTDTHDGTTGGKTGGRPSVSMRENDVSISANNTPESSDNARPMLVHCSAGCGRTGAFCTVDSVVDMLKRQRQNTAKVARRHVKTPDKRVAEQTKPDQRSRTATLDTDADGDTSMDEGLDNDDDDEDMASPLASFKEPRTPLLGTFAKVTSAPADTNEGDHDGDIDVGDLDVSWLGDDSTDLVARTVEDFRKQRLSMVQSLRQFVLCYETIIEWVWRAHQKS